ncbi:MAG TPA: methylated-DNA--[protein]-cysteine S-methyltransferase [Solirubrobacteraceae bacterium]|nr:methylated-DNA--[protein]-cysteine S-methyltransferase [Solirubrobacteraceae bacterium]
MTYTTLHPSPVGDILLRAGADGRLTELYLRHDETAAPDGGPFDAVREQLDAYFAGELETFDLDLDPHGTPFQRRVWDALLEIPFGETISYSEVARRLGDPRLVRAVGLANGRNPISIVIPCHRVIGADGSLVGYGGGLDRKRWLLEHEAVAAGRRLAV